jgi:hypothetical protein
MHSTLDLNAERTKGALDQLFFKYSHLLAEKGMFHADLESQLCSEQPSQISSQPVRQVARSDAKKAIVPPSQEEAVPASEPQDSERRSVVPSSKQPLPLL